MRKWVLLVITFLLLFGCANKKGGEKARGKKGEGKILAQVNAGIITLEEFKRKIKILPENATAILGYDVDTLEGEKRFLDDLISRELLVQEAYRRGLDKQEDVQMRLDNLEDLRKQILVNKLIEDLREEISVSEQEIKEYYDTHKKAFTEPEKIRAREIVLRSEKEAKQVLIQLLQGANFQMLAKEKSIAPNASRGGDMGFFARGRMPKAFDEVVFNLKKGQMSGIIALKDGYHIVKVIDKVPSKQKPLEKVKEEIRERLEREKEAKKLQSLLASLREKADIKINEELLLLK
ncbi:MAG: hypothetical protein DRP75_02525 [Candidatus Omnitrophota bacterium]|nr:MAG: hypothetical protein DRP75_02525 [Candidatus Omnitrophota bacterium]